MMENDQFIALGVSEEQPGLGITKPFDQRAATAQVDALHREALQLGGKNEGPAGPLGEGFYAGYFRDLDGNKLNFFAAG